MCCNLKKVKRQKIQRQRENKIRKWHFLQLHNLHQFVCYTKCANNNFQTKTSRDSHLLFPNVFSELTDLACCTIHRL